LDPTVGLEASHSGSSCCIQQKAQYTVETVEFSNNNAAKEPAEQARSLFRGWFLRLINRLKLICCERKILFHG
jgi:hypothetical protein